MDSFFFASIIAGYILFLLFIIITLFMTIIRKERKCRNAFSEAVIVFSEVLYTIIGPVIGFTRYDQFGSDIPFAKQHVLTVILIVISSSLFYWTARFTSKTPNPILRIIVSAGLLQGILLCLVTSIHFTAFFPLGMIYPTLGFELLSPLIALLLLSREFYFYTHTDFDYSEQLPYRNELGFTPLPVKIMEAPFMSRLFIYGTLTVFFIAGQMLFSYGCGQDIDSLVKAYTHSHGFIFSN